MFKAYLEAKRDTFSKKMSRVLQRGNKRYILIQTIDPTVEIKDGLTKALTETYLYITQTFNSPGWPQTRTAIYKSLYAFSEF